MRYLISSILTLVLFTACPPASAEQYAPSLMYSTLLNGVIVFPNNGSIRLDGIQAVFLPDAQSASGMIYPYNPKDGGKIWAILSSTNGTEIYRFDFYAELLKSPYWLLNSYDATNLQTGENAGGGLVEFGNVGNYVLDFYLDSGKFYTFPFSMELMPSPDPFAGQDKYVLSGPWEDWGYFYYRDADPANSLQFKVWLRNDVYEARTLKPWMEIYRGGTLVATGRDMNITLQLEWTRHDFDVISPMEGTGGGAYFKAKDLLANDGDYILKLKLDDKPYGEWPFAIQGGKFIYTGRAVRGAGDPLIFIEGGRDAWWYERKE